MRDVCLTTIDNGPYTRDHPRDPGEDAQRVIVELTGDITEDPLYRPTRIMLSVA